MLREQTIGVIAYMLAFGKDSTALAGYRFVGFGDL
jgi:hypothetical protein